MGVLVLAVSHVDHGLSPDQLAWVLEQFSDKSEFFVGTVELPEELGTVPCGLHGPIMGDGVVVDAEVLMEVRGTRSWPSRLCYRPVRYVREVTVIAGPHVLQGTGDSTPDQSYPCVLYTAFGGPLALQEVGDPAVVGNPEKLFASRLFWSHHALSIEGQTLTLPYAEDSRTLDEDDFLLSEDDFLLIRNDAKDTDGVLAISGNQDFWDFADQGLPEPGHVCYVGRVTEPVVGVNGRRYVRFVVEEAAVDSNDPDRS